MNITSRTAFIIFFTTFNSCKSFDRSEDGSEKSRVGKCNYTFFKENKISETYWTDIKTFYKDEAFKEKCILHFSKKTFLATKVLNAGASVILLLDNGEILRLPKLFEQRNDLKDFFLIYIDLTKNRVPVVTTYNDEDSEDKIEYLRHDFLNIRFTLRNYLVQTNELTASENEKIEKSLLDFVASLSPYIFIADLHAGNIVYTKEGKWLAIDFGASDEKKFINFAGKIFVHFVADPTLRSKAHQFRLLHGGKDPKEILKQLRAQPDLFRQLSVNTLCNPDPSVIRFIAIPKQLKEKFNSAIALKRLHDI